VVVSGRHDQQAVDPARAEVAEQLLLALRILL
jgi:hypothetical protein